MEMGGNHRKRLKSEWRKIDRKKWNKWENIWKW